VFADQSSLGHAYARNVRQQSHVTSNAKATRMRVALSVVENEIRWDTKVAESAERSGGLAKGKESGHVGESGLFFGDGEVDQLEIREAQDRHRRSRDGALVFEGDIDASYAVDGTKQIARNDAVSQPVLERDGFSNLHGPPVRKLEFHTTLNGAPAM
jgi:hypothetical protein